MRFECTMEINLKCFLSQTENLNKSNGSIGMEKFLFHFQDSDNRMKN